MKKYVKSKDGYIYESKALVDFGYGLFIEFEYGVLPVAPIVKESDDIEELFDGFVTVEVAGGFKDDFHLYKDLELAKWAADEKVTEVYGIVRTDRGLIYAAKLNKEGEWELL